MSPPVPRFRMAGEIRLLDKMEQEVAGVRMPLSYMADFYTLR